MTTEAPALRSVCVFCGSQGGARPEYLEAARALGVSLARREITTVYGGGHIGMMGAVADAALAAGGRVVGVIPEHLMRPEVAHQKLDELIVVDSMHTRKRTMAARSDAFVVLPGGYGTLEEMFEMLTWLEPSCTPSRSVSSMSRATSTGSSSFCATRPTRPHTSRIWDLLIVEPGVDLLLERLPLHGAQLARSHPPRGTPRQG